MVGFYFILRNSSHGKESRDQGRHSHPLCIVVTISQYQLILKHFTGTMSFNYHAAEI